MMIRTATPSTGDNSVNSGQLRAFVERIERLDEDIASLNADKSEIYKEAKGDGYDAKIMRKVIQRRRMDPAKRAEEDAITELYLSALGEA